MKKNIHLSIPQSCHENWDNMGPMEKGRYCASCEKHVIDFTNMSDHQLALFFKKNEGDRVCGRFFNDQLDRDIEIPSRRIPWIKYFFQFALPAFLISMKATAQGNVKLLKKHTITKHRIVLHDRSNCSFITQPPANMIKINLPLALAGQTNAELALPEKLTQQIMMPEQSLTGSVGMIVLKQPAKKKESKPIQLFTQKLMDTASRFFKVFPNPVSPGASLNIEWKETDEGYFNFELFDISGKKVYSKEIWIDKDARLLNLEIPSVRGGHYFLHASNAQSGKGFTEKIVIE